MKKHKAWLLPVIIVVALILFLWIIKAPIMSAYLSSKLKANGSFSSVKLSSSKMTIGGLKIFNPRGSKNKYALTTKQIIVNYSLKKLFSSPSIIDSIVVEDSQLNIECSNPLCTQNNWTIIAKNISKMEKSKKEGKEVIVSTLTLQNLDVEVMGLGLDFTKKKNIHKSNLTFKNISSKQGFPTQQLIKAIFKSADLQDYLKGILDLPKVLEKFKIPFTMQKNEDNSFEESLKSL
ncbi:MAG: hypothetical protein JXA94_00760 [Parachlamydiales bacterium]|nr:hypothetical protein [Parachlamydiales bacterium]